MKLILCRKCQDVFKLQYDRRECNCGEAWGKYEDDGYHARYGGQSAVPIGFGNGSLATAVKNQPLEGRGLRFDAFVISKECPTMRKAKG